MLESDQWYASIWIFVLLGSLVLADVLLLVVNALRGFKLAEYPRCRKCDYIWRNGNETACPECGCGKRPVRRVLSGKQQRRRWACVLLLFLLFFHCFGSAVVWHRIDPHDDLRREPWYRAVVPTTVWIALMPLFPEDVATPLRTRLTCLDCMDCAERKGFSDQRAILALPAWKADLLAWSCKTALTELHANSELWTKNQWGWKPDISPTGMRLISWLCTLVEEDAARAPALAALFDLRDPELIKCLSHRGPEVVAHESVVHAMVRALDDPTLAVRRAAAHALLEVYARSVFVDSNLILTLIDHCEASTDEWITHSLRTVLDDLAAESNEAALWVRPDLIEAIQNAHQRRRSRVTHGRSGGCTTISFTIYCYFDRRHSTSPLISRYPLVPMNWDAVSFRRAEVFAMR